MALGQRNSYHLCHDIPPDLPNRMLCQSTTDDEAVTNQALNINNVKRLDVDL